jgi:ubiquinone/menaquinone biosynthesis C-methylase UbiE
MNHSASVNRREGAPGKHHHGGKSSESLLYKETIMDHLELVPGQIVLDAGCGTGYMSRAFAERLGNVGRVYALDPDEAVIVSLRKSTRGTNILPVVGDITGFTRIPESTLDLIYVSTVLHGFSPEQIRGFDSEVNRLLKPRGRLAIVEIVKRPTPFGPPIDMRFSPDDLKRVVTLLPLACVDVGEHFYMQLFEKPSGVRP